MECYKMSQYNIELDNSNESVLLYNSYTGAVVKLDNITYKKYQGEITIGCPFFEDLFHNGFIVSSNIDEYARVRNEINLDINNPMDQSLNFVIAPTMKCNYACYYCYEKRTPVQTEDMTKLTSDEVVSFILKSVKKHTESVSICWFGGEPLLKLDSIMEIGSRVKNNLGEKVKFTSRIITNGVLLTEDVCTALIKSCNLTSAQITLDGLEDNYCQAKKAKREQYESVIHNIISCASLITISICYNLSKQNQFDLEPLTNYLLIEKGLLNVIKLYLVRVKPYSKTCELSEKCFDENEFEVIQSNFDNLLKSLGQVQKTEDVRRATPCSIIKNSGAAIDPQGYLYKCEHFLGQKECALGDVKCGWYYNKQYFDFQQVSIDENCSQCAYFPRCGFALCSELRVMGKQSDGDCAYKSVLQNRIKRVVLK